MTERTEDAQTQALRAFLLLCALDSGRDAWQGRLVLVRGLDGPGRAVSVASSIAGAACLALDSRAEVCRATLRAGACDFVVNSVDEALRILKNEIRKRKPISVAVAMPEEAALDELVGRGVTPDMFVVSSPDTVDAAGPRLRALGIRIVPAGEAERMAAEYISARGLELREFRFASAQELSAFDQKLATALPGSELRRRWAAVAPGFFYRDRPFRRVVCLASGELAKLK